MMCKTQNALARFSAHVLYRRRKRAAIVLSVTLATGWAQAAFRQACGMLRLPLLWLWLPLEFCAFFRQTEWWRSAKNIPASQE